MELPARPGPESATPGSYGLRPSGFRLPRGTGLGPVRLQVADLGRSLVFYEGVLGLERLGREASSAWLGSRPLVGAGAAAPSSTLVELVERRGARAVPRRGRLGLFHLALLLPDRPSLGRFVRHLERLGVQAGAGDHRVSESFYLQDPDNLGIEVYADRPREGWLRVGSQLVMATDPVDVAGLLDQAGEERWNGLPAGTVVGHVHLHVGDLAGAVAFYSEALGFDRMVWDYPGALFLAADGYHHHLGTNIWAGPAATAPPPDEAQLLEWTVELPEPASLEAAADSLKRHGHRAERDSAASAAGFVSRDPWGTAIRLRVRDPRLGLTTQGS